MKEIAFDQDRFYPAVEPPDSANGKSWFNFFFVNFLFILGELRNVAAGKCVDTQFKGTGERFELRKCISQDPSGGGEQVIEGGDSQCNPKPCIHFRICE